MTFILVAWVAQFHKLLDLGLYEDDYWFISQAMGKDPSYLLDRLKVFVTLPQGRPIGFYLPDLLSWIGDRLGGLPAIYLLGMALVVLNTYLFYRLLRYRLPAVASIAGGLAFLLFPADTTKILLTHDFQLQPSLTFLLLASLAYASDRRMLAYVLCVGSLLSYENGFLPFFGLPLFLRRWSRDTLLELVRHGLILVGILALAVLVRYLVGEDRATSSVGGVFDILPRVIGSMVIGPARALALFLYGPLRAVPSWDLPSVLLTLATLVGLTWLFWKRPRLPDSPALATSDLLQIAAAGLVMLCLAYALAFTHFPPNAVTGRGTSVHLGATFGASILFAAVAAAILQQRRWRLAAATLVSAYFALAAGYYITIGRDFTRSWQIQQDFWRQVVACCSDLRDGTVLLYELDPSPDTMFIFTNSWADPLVLTQTFRFPADWAAPPRLFSLVDWRERVEATGGGRLRWWVPGASWDEHWEELPQGNVILLREENGRLSRVQGDVDVAGQRLTLKPKEPDGVWPKAQLHDLLLE